MRTILIAFGLMALPALGSPAAAVAKKYPGQTIVASCPGGFLNRQGDEAVVIHDEAAKLHRVLWVSVKDDIRELDTIPKKSDNKFEIQCMPAKAAAEHKKAAESSEGIHSSLKFPKGKGILCYFTDEVTAKCWTVGKKPGWLVDAGGWQT